MDELTLRNFAACLIPSKVFYNAREEYKDVFNLYSNNHLN